MWPYPIIMLLLSHVSIVDESYHFFSVEIRWHNFAEILCLLILNCELVLLLDYDCSSPDRYNNSIHVLQLTFCGMLFYQNMLCLLC
jgi:hypothetical protein